MSGRLPFKKKLQLLAQAKFFFPHITEWIFVRVGQYWVMKFRKEDPAGLTPQQHVHPINREVCKHEPVAPKFNEQEAKTLSAPEVRNRWPRFDGVCPRCNQMLILYFDWAHYVYGDW